MLGLACGTLIGIAYLSVAKTGRSAPGLATRELRLPTLWICWGFGVLWAGVGQGLRGGVTVR